MDYGSFIGGSSDATAGKMAKPALLGVVAIFIIIALATLPGTIGHKQKYVEKDNVEKELKLSKMSIPVSLMSFSLLIVIGVSVWLVMEKKAQ